MLARLDSWEALAKIGYVLLVCLLTAATIRSTPVVAVPIPGRCGACSLRAC
jgi:hypothetical protein